MMLLSLGGTLAEQATPACDLYFLLSAPSSQIAKITHLLKENKKRHSPPMFGLKRLQLPLVAPPPPLLISFSLQSSSCDNAMGTNRLLDGAVIASANKG